jgi:aminoglycoside/choline kinase family phosphotransferase
MDQRGEALVDWARYCLGDMTGNSLVKGEVEAISDDASFRRYFRLRFERALECDHELVSESKRAILSHSQFLLVDAPPAHENSEQFVHVAKLFREAGMLTPLILEADYERGFMLLQDFGDALYLPALQAGNDVDALYRGAMASLVQLQAHGDTADLPPYDRALLRKELNLFNDWFCEGFLQLSLSEEERALLERTWTFLEDGALSQPQVCVHRDYHSRNLMILSPDPEEAPGVIDFQDAVVGANTYDLVSLLRDCYVVWPAARVRAWALEFREMALAVDLLEDDSVAAEEAFLRDFDLMGLQRHLKVIGIFSRLNLRDGKPRYMADIPLVIDYVLQVAAQHPEMSEFLQWFQTKILPIATPKLQAFANKGTAQ